jgi:ubiquinone/menaquinone biosynthesis C-methylase UbiE
MTCILSLHHIENLTHILTEVKRVLKPNGIFILIEHDNYTYFDSMIIEIQHTLFAFFYDNNKDYIKNPLYSKYFNNMEWEFIMDKNGFKLLDSGPYVNNITESKRYDQQFYAIYKNCNKK